MTVHAQRLLNVARALDESALPGKFTMCLYGYKGKRRGFLLLHRDCGTPACALGHYAFRTDLQKSFRLDTRGDLVFGRSTEIDYDSSEILVHFGITRAEAETLFGRQGCNDAQSAAEASVYIREFVARKWPAVNVRTLKLVTR